MKRKATIVVGSAVAVFAAILLGMSIANSKRVDSITVTFVGPGDEVRDRTILGIGKEDELPDYRLDVIHTRGKRNCGTLLNQSAAGGITFRVAEDIPVTQIQELVLIEDDKIENDTIARVQFSGNVMTESGYRFEAATSRSFQVGMEWFFATPVGKAISFGLALGIAIVVVMLFV